MRRLVSNALAGALVVFFVGAISACASEQTVDLTINISTSLVAGPEFNLVEVALIRRVGASEVILQAIDHEAAFGDPFTRGVEVAEFTDLVKGEWTVRARLRRPDGTLLVQRRMVTDVDRDLTITIPITRDCVGVMCPGESGSAAFTECLAGSCVDPRCNPEDETTREFCPEVTFCNAATECGDTAPCATNACVDGVCQSEPATESAGACDLTHQWCNPDEGCQALANVTIDAGVEELADGGDAFDASEDGAMPMTVDAGPDSNVTCRVCRQVWLDGDRFVLICEDAPCDSIAYPEGGISYDVDGGDAGDGVEAGAGPEGGSGFEAGTGPEGGASVDAAVDATDPTSCDFSARILRFRDNDHDGYGDIGMGRTANMSACPADPSYVDVGGDCDDTRSETHEGATEICDGLDNNCDDIVDGATADADCVGDGSTYCLAGACTDDCTDITSPVSGIILESDVWCPSSGTITIQGVLTIRQEATIVVAPGVTINVISDGPTSGEISLRGQLELHGTSDDPIVLHSGNVTPIAGDWNGVSFSQITRAPVFYAEHTTLAHADYGVLGTAGRAVFVDSVLQNNTNASSHTETYVTRSTFRDNDGALVAGGRWMSDTLIENNNLAIAGTCNGERVVIRSNTTAIRYIAGTLSSSIIEDNDVAFDGIHQTGSLVTASTITGNLALGAGPGSAPAFLYNNLIADNGGPLRIYMQLTSMPTSRDAWSGNTICNNGGTDAKVELSAQDQYLRGNYWCTTDTAAINGRIYDAYDDGLLGFIYYTPILTEADPLTPVYVP